MKTIAVAQASIETASLTYAVEELYREGAVVLLLHAARVLSPNTTVLHSAPHSAYAVPTGDDPAVLQEKIVHSLRHKLGPIAEAKGAPFVVQVKLMDVEASARDVADWIAAAAEEERASVLVTARDDDAAGGGSGGEGGGGGGGEGSGGGERLGHRLVKRPSLSTELLNRAGKGCAVVLVPAGWSSSGNGGGGGGGSHHG